MFHTTFSQGKHSTQGKRKRKGLLEPKCKGQVQGLVEPKCKGQEQVIVIESKWKGQEHSLLSEPKCKGQRYCRPGSKDRVTNHLYVH